MATNPDLVAILPLLPESLQEQLPLYDETYQPDMYAAIGVSAFLACVCVALRIYGRRLQGQKLWWDDYTSIIALFFAMVSSGALLSLVYLGMGRHQIVIILEHMDHMGPLLRMLIVSNALYFPSICFSKMSILFQYRRLFPTKKFKYVLIAVGLASTIYCVVGMIVITALCLPVKDPSLERPTEHPLHCSNIRAMIFWIVSWNAAFDFIILLLPMRYVWRLQTTLRRKIQLTGLFSIGSFVVAISILRTVYFEHLSPSDFTWTAASGNMWSEVEGCMSIVVGCLPAMMPIFRRKTRKSTPPPPKKINLVTFGSSGKGKKLNPNDISVIMQTTVTTTTHRDGDYTELVDQKNQDGQAHYFPGSMNQAEAVHEVHCYPGDVSQVGPEHQAQYYQGDESQIGPDVYQVAPEHPPQYYQGGVLEVGPEHQTQYFQGRMNQIDLQNQPQYYHGAMSHADLENQTQYYHGAGRWQN